MLLCISLCACTSGNSVKNSNSAESTQSEIMEFEEIDASKFNNGNLNICFITKTYGNNYWDTLIQGAKDSAEANNINLYCASVKNENDTDGLAHLLNEAYDMQPDAVIVSPADTIPINDAINKIHGAKIPLIYVDTIMNGRQFDACFMTDNMQAGRMVARYMIKKLKEVGYTDTDALCVGIHIGSRNSQTIIERLAGFNEYWSSNTPENWRVIEPIRCNDGSADTAREQCIEMIDSYSSLAGLIGLNNGSTVGLCNGLTELERKDIVLIGFDYSNEIAKLISEGEYPVATMVQCQYDMGYNSVTTAIDICNGGSVEYKFIDTGVARIDNSNYNSSSILNLIQ